MCRRPKSRPTSCGSQLSIFLSLGLPPPRTRGSKPLGQCQREALNVYLSVHGTAVWVVVGSCRPEPAFFAPLEEINRKT